MSALLPGPGLEVEVCLAVGESERGGTWDAGLWDYNVWQQTDTSYGDWVDVTCSVVDGFTMTAGASSADGVVTRWEAATVAYELVGEQFDPRSGPHAGVLGPAVGTRVRWRPVGAPDWITAFLGYIDNDGFTYDPKTERATVAATDGTRVFAGFDGLEQAAQGANETAAERVTRIADMVNWPAELRDVTAGGVALQPTTLAENAWTMLLAVADTDLALLWVNRAGALAYRPQGKVIPSLMVNAVITCDEAGVPDGVTAVRPVNVAGQQAHVLRNVVAVSRQSTDTDPAVTVTLRDDASIARYQPATYQRTDLQHVDDAWSTDVAEALIMVGAWPTTCPDTATLDTRADLGAGPLLLGLEPNLSIAVEDTAGGRWQCEPAGWSVTVSKLAVYGDIQLLDVSPWFGAGWDSDGWELGKWGF
jgi:hypothetical protein